MPTARYELAAAEAGGKIYALGGNNSLNNYLSGIQNVVEEYDPAANTWTTKAPMPTVREVLAAAAAGGKIYAIGGFDNRGVDLNVVEEYDPAPTSNTWTTKAPMLTTRSNLTAAEAGGKIYGIGGASGAPLNVVEAYTPGPRVTGYILYKN